MNILLFIIAIILIIILLLYFLPLNILFKFNSNTLDFNLKFLWLSPFFKGIITSENNKLVYKIFFFNKKVLEKDIKIKFKNKNKINFIKLIEQIQPTDFSLETSYGFNDPSITGALCGGIYILSEYMNIDYLCNNPNFSSDYSYFNTSGSMKINIISTSLKLLNLYRKNNLRQVSYNK